MDCSAGKKSSCGVGDPGSIPELGRSPGEGKGYLLQYSGLENSMDYTYNPWGCKELDMTLKKKKTHYLCHQSFIDDRLGYSSFFTAINKIRMNVLYALSNWFL